ncbi:MAG: thiamine biosynthesis lipoprotein [Gammaproteobacteria bacterium]|jgi:thiamine biosynthesis lipoprotein
MASPCEILVDTLEKKLAAGIIETAVNEATRIEHKFSRYIAGNIVDRINQSNGKWVELDSETERLIKFCRQCYDISDGLFDITSGILRRLWKFDDRHKVPSKKAIKQLLDCIGFEKITFQDKQINLPESMEIDFGGVGKEYAVDRIIGIIKSKTAVPVLVNLGGDISTSRNRQNGEHWTIGIENPENSDQTVSLIKVSQGSIATSGDSKRFLMVRGKRYGHILNPKTGWPVVDSPRSVTVGARTCTDAGILATLAMLQGNQAESFLELQELPFYCYR